MRMGSDDIVKNMYDVSDDIDEEDNATRKTLYEALRGFQSLFGEARERTFKAISFAKLLRKDLEVSAEFNLTGGFDELMIKLQETEHVQVRILLKYLSIHDTNILGLCPSLSPSLYFCSEDYF